MRRSTAARVGLNSVSAILAITILCPLSAFAAWPADKPIRMIIPYAPGGATDILGRVVSAKLSTRLGQTVVVENKPGAGSMIGSDFVARSAPDGYTLLLGSISNVLNGYFYKEPLYDIRVDLEPITQIVSVPNFLAVHNSVAAQTVEELVAMARKSPGTLSCATSGVGSSPYLSCELFKIMANVDIINTPFKGGAPAIHSTMGKQTTMFFANEAMPYIQAGQVRALGVTTPERSPYVPEIPAIAETFPEYDVTAWYGVWTSPKTPPDIVNRISDEVQEVLKDPQVLESLKSLGATPVQSNPPQFKAYVESEVVRWGKITKQMNVVAQ